MRALLKLNSAEEFSSGLWVDPPKNQQALWKTGENIQFADGTIEKAGGYTKESSYVDDITGVTAAYADGVRRVYIGSGRTVYKRDDGVETLIGSGFSTQGVWDFEPFGTFLLATNNVDAPQIWENTGIMQPWPTCPFGRARLVKKIQVFPVLFKGQEVAWPSYNNFKDFVPGIGKRSGQFFIRDLDGDVVAVEPLGSSLIYYTQDMFGVMTFVGGEAAMSFATQQGGGIGAVGPKAVVATGPFHFGMSRKGIWKSDGNSFEYIAHPAIARWIESQIEWLAASTVVAMHEEAKQQVLFYFTCKDGVRRGVGYTYGGPTPNRWSILRANITAAGDQNGTLPGAPVGVGKDFGYYGVGANAGLNPLISSIRSAPLDAGSTDRIKRWQMVEVHYENVGAFEMRVGYSDVEKAEPEWGDWFVVDRENWLSDRESNFITLEFRSIELGSSFRFGGLEIYGEPVGRTR